VKLDSTLGKLAAGHDLPEEEMTAAMDAIMSGECQDGEIGLLLTALKAKGETTAEVVGAARALRRHMIPLPTGRGDVVDTCGTGGDQSGTFNISTAAALVAAAAGVPVAKHGNRSVSSKSGSADVLSELGVRIDLEPSAVGRCLETLGICFCFAPSFHPAMKRVAAVRKQLGVPTIFNMLGPLCNPAGAPYQLLGVGRPELRGLLAAALAQLGTTKGVIVAGDDGLDEVTLAGDTHVSLVVGGEVRETVWSPVDFGLAPAPLDALKVDGPAASARIIREVLAGEAGPARDIVVMNAAAAIFAGERSDDLRECARWAAEAIDSGDAAALLRRLAEAAG
jgi:anthranilate phosphoribosyltransferase